MSEALGWNEAALLSLLIKAA